MSQVVLHEIARVTGVHLPSGWHEARAGTFEVREDGCYGELDVNRLAVGMKAQCRTFSFTEPSGAVVSGPLMSVMALRTDP